MALKLDISKAYNCVEWPFIKCMMSKMGFTDSFIDFILRCISSVEYSILINGEEGSSFNPSRGMRQRDPLSPYLFLFCGEGLSVLMRLASREIRILGAKVCRSSPPITHLMFANDCILFGEVPDRGITVIKDILREYESCSGQCVNFEKSTAFFSSNVNDQDKNMAFQVLNVHCSTEPEKYLRLPNMRQRKKMAFQTLKDRLKQKINNWSIRHISQGGRDDLFGGKKVMEREVCIGVIGSHYVHLRKREIYLLLPGRVYGLLKGFFRRVWVGGLGTERMSLFGETRGLLAGMIS
ncbi:LINE-1 reverse transcriptase isogeny [Gossypium australe]|uniref:LINE-1 reverse transcriptase isogeny n=1 Tax=Gossypium australe TaxID=47621 RepID=A0A5B6VDP6_9ROSI|nr:LINE-1 reverse transcriptase isogeny [Gossypium australe]